MTSSRRTLALLATGVAATVALAGCSTSTPAASPNATGGSDDTIRVVTSTNVYGQVAQEIGGDVVTVTPIITSTAQDPHEYEATAQDQLVVAEADLIVENGGGYDGFMDAMIEATGTEAPVITAVTFNHDYPGDEGDEHDHAEEEGDDHDHAEEEGDDHDHAEEEGDDHDHAEEEGDDHAGHDHIEGFNEHVWYDPHTMEHVAEAIAEELAVLDPDNAELFEQNAAAFIEGVEGLEASLDEIAASHGGAGVFVTEPVPLYLTAAADLDNLTPDEFSEAVEEGQDVPPATLLEAIEILESGDVAVVIANSQTGGAETTQVIDTATAQSIPVLEFSETLPEGQTYISWMEQNIGDLEASLAR
ncbi:hypothetical protein GCM10022200_21770 [Microbacterium awajiense]|uniref:Metal ABC transporter substrate-binding protein n=1 Tax=Microbacterium awajiense TaxID=415214 RepID=A0ABP7AR88_9MICO